jgi:hypothetical protein
LPKAAKAQERNGIAGDKASSIGEKAFSAA